MIHDTDPILSVLNRLPDTGLLVVDSDHNIIHIHDPRQYLLPSLKGTGKKNSLYNIKEYRFKRDLISTSEKIQAGKVVEPYIINTPQQLRLTGFPVTDDTGKSKYGLLVFQKPADILQSKADTLIREKDTAEEANRMKSDFIASLSHEIRTPLNAIVGFTEQLLKTDLSSQQHEYLEIIDNSSMHLLDLVNEILTFSKLDSEEMQLDQTDFNLQSLLNEIYDTFIIKAEMKGINLRYHFDNKLDMIVLGDAFRLKQIINNLLSNAIKFTDYGYVELVVSGVLTDLNRLWTKVVVKDTGIGIPDDKKSEVFTEFKQANSGITRTHGGTGLGLTICKKLTELMGGRITFVSTEGKGSAFTIEIPLSKSNLKSITEDDIAIDHELLKGRSALIVDDDAMNRLLGKIIIEGFNMEADLADCGAEAIKRLEKHNYDIILLDLHMPDISGLDVTRYIRQEKREQDARIVAVTADVIKDDLELCFAAGFNDFLIKPYRELTLYNKICKVMGLKSQAIRPDKTEIIMQELEVVPLYNLYELRKVTRGDEGFFREMIETFAGSATHGIAQMRSALDAGEWHMVGETAHRLAPSYKHLDVKAVVSDLVELKRKAFNEPKPEQLSQLIDRIDKTTTDIIDSLGDEEP